MIRVRGQTSIEAGATNLAEAIRQTVQSFGVQSCHLVGHSKGGIWIRQFLESNAALHPTQRIGVISVTTLDTPHHGSVLSDIAAGDHLIIRLARFFSDGARAALGEGVRDLTTWRMAEFNAQYPNPPQLQLVADSFAWGSYVIVPKYYSTSADADRNGNEELDATEAAPASQWEADKRYKILRRGRYSFLLRNVPPNHVTPYGAEPDFNDTAVTVRSARHPGFPEIANMTGAFGRNHTTILGPTMVPPLVLSKIRLAELLQDWTPLPEPPSGPGN